MSAPAITEINHYINGAIVRDEGGRRAPVYNPATGEQTGSVALASADRTREAIAAAAEAFPAWQAITPLRRARVMFKFKALLEDNLPRLAEAITREHGKVYSDARGEVIRGLEVVEFACGIPHLLKGGHSIDVGTDVDSWSQQHPVGVCAGITPFNFPAMVPMWMFPIAIACGNTFVLKPSEKDPTLPMMLAELLAEAGLPAGVFNVLNGDREAVDTLLTDDRVAAISFVGSTPIAEHVYSTGAAHGKRAQALGGAKNHMVVMPDADIEGAADALMGAAYGSAGERCMAISVAVPVGEETADRLVAALQSRLAGLRVGNGLDSNEPEMGPLVTHEHRQKVADYVEIGVQEGAALVHDGRAIEVPGHSHGFFLGPCLFDRVTPEMRIYREEIFGPVLSVVRAADFDEAAAIVNGHEFGNGTAIFTRDGDAARTYAQAIEAGMVGINVPIPVPMAFYSFGGWKRSRFGVLHAHGPDAVRFYTRMKTITARWPRGVRSDNQFVMPTMQ
ncbi:CoA-acylating methylmalonate-semialdehyde dehydrogenase [Spiribacter onubensis]|uniref:methylmalonate-semialdehyde dehydrogenase (CoA acylating) n=1 Tax=Spiribacter onubensis TaxID=3122420 RepID=A0ABV3S8V0_9GAMM